jgi:condensin complex subunit 1
VLGHLACDAFDQASNDEAVVNTRDSLLSILEERVHDVHAFTRSKVLQTWQSLVEAKAVPLAFLPSVTKSAVSRLDDKSANVRRNALALLRTLLQYNPYSGDLRVTEFQRSLAAVEKQLGYQLRPGDAALLRGDDAADDDDDDDDDNDKTKNDNDSAEKKAEEDQGAEANDDDEKDNDDDDDDDDNKEDKEEEIDEEAIEAAKIGAADEDDAMQSADDEAIAVDDDDNNNTDDNNNNNNTEQQQQQQQPEEPKVPKLSDAESAKLKAQRKYLRHSIRFIWTIEDAVERAAALLSSSTVSDVLEAIQFFVVANEFRVETARSGVRNLLGLVWSKEVNGLSCVWCMRWLI